MKTQRSTELTFIINDKLTITHTLLKTRTLTRQRKAEFFCQARRCFTKLATEAFHAPSPEQYQEILQEITTTMLAYSHHNHPAVPPAPQRFQEPTADYLNRLTNY